jgi:hypothetical protein
MRTETVTFVLLTVYRSISEMSVMTFSNMQSAITQAQDSHAPAMVYSTNWDIDKGYIPGDTMVFANLQAKSVCGKI